MQHLQQQTNDSHEIFLVRLLTLLLQKLHRKTTERCNITSKYTMQQANNHVMTSLPPQNLPCQPVDFLSFLIPNKCENFCTTDQQLDIFFWFW